MNKLKGWDNHFQTFRFNFWVGFVKFLYVFHLSCNTGRNKEQEHYLNTKLSMHRENFLSGLATIQCKEEILFFSKLKTTLADNTEQIMVHGNKVFNKHVCYLLKQANTKCSRMTYRQTDEIPYFSIWLSKAHSTRSIHSEA